MHEVRYFGVVIVAVDRGYAVDRDDDQGSAFVPSARPGRQANWSSATASLSACIRATRRMTSCWRSAHGACRR